MRQTKSEDTFKLRGHIHPLIRALVSLSHQNPSLIFSCCQRGMLGLTLNNATECFQPSLTPPSPLSLSPLLPLLHPSLTLSLPTLTSLSLSPLLPLHHPSLPPACCCSCWEGPSRPSIQQSESGRVMEPESLMTCDRQISRPEITALWSLLGSLPPNQRCLFTHIHHRLHCQTHTNSNPNQY